MPACGGYSPYPRRFGGSGNDGNKPLLQIIHESLNAQRGTAFDANNDETIVWLENMAIARAITFDGWGTNERLANQWDPDRMTDMLRRWEKILKIPVPADATESARRAEVKKRFESIGRLANHARLLDRLTTELGAVFVAVEYISIANAVILVPDSTYPFGAVGGVPWYSTVAHILVRLTKPAGYTEGDFYEAAARVSTILDPIVPAWVSFDWYRAPEIGTPINVTGGPSAAGFYLDERNLDNSVFDV